MTVPDLEKFKELKERKASWEERLNLIHQTFPSTVELEWRQALQDVDLLGKVLRDILKVEQAPQGRSGPRPVLDKKKALAKLRQYMGRDFTDLEFPESLQVIAANMTVSDLATKVGLNRALMYKYMNGSKKPGVYELEMIAHAFGKNPSYFLEYRIMYVLGYLAHHMALAPEMTVDLYRQIKGKNV